MSIEERQKIERRIVEKVIDDALFAGATISVEDGGGSYEVRRSRDRATILAALFSMDSDTIYMILPNGKKGMVQFIYGNDGHDVIADFSLALDPILYGASELADQIERGEAA